MLRKKLLIILLVTFTLLTVLVLTHNVLSEVMTSIIIKHVFNHEHSCPYLKKFNVKYMVSKIEVIDKYSKEIIWRGMVRYVNETLYIEPEENYTFPMALNPGNYTIKIMTSMDLQVSEKVKIPPIVISKISE